MSGKRVGQILRDAREEQRLTVRDVSKDTNIAVKFILALENEDYSQFPAETFAMGFLKTYSDYLKLDTAFIMNLYRGEQMEDAYAPLEELTKPTKPIVNSVKGIDKNKTITLATIIIFILAFITLGYYFSDMMEESDGKPNNKVNNSSIKTNKVKGIPSDISFMQQPVSEAKDTPVILTPEKGISFSIGTQQCKLFLIETTDSDSSISSAKLGFSVYPESYIHNFRIKEKEDVLLSFKNPKLNFLQKELSIHAQIITSSSAKILLSIGKEQPIETLKNTGSAPIQITIKFTKDTYLDYSVDGQPGENGRIKKGSVKKIEAMERVEIKVLDGSAVELTKNGEKVGKLGRPGQTVKKVYYRVPSPYDSTKYIIKESGD